MQSKKSRTGDPAYAMTGQVFRRFIEFVRTEAASGLILLAATLFALLWANSPWIESYHSLWRQTVMGMSLHHWVNDGLMTLFFLVVGLEIKRETLEGELSSRSRAALPVVAALGGMIVPALIFWILNADSSGARGWGIPMATDIAFALGVLTFFKNRIPSSLKVFLLALAVADDLGAVVVIAFAYTQQVAWVYVLAGLGILTALLVINRLRIHNAAIYLLAGIPLWACLLRSGVHSTIAGVLLALVIPARSGHRVEGALHPWVAFGIMPAFALANAGVSLGNSTLNHPVSVGVVCGLVLGKQSGITLFSWIAVRLRLAALPSGASWTQLYGVACLAGIGFTMAIFVANLALDEVQLIENAKLAVLAASVFSAAFGALILTWGSRANRDS